MTRFPNSGAYRRGLTSRYGGEYADSLEHSINYASNTKHEDNILALILTAHIASKGGGTTVVDFEISSLDFGALAHLMMATDPKRARAAFDESRRRKPKP